MGTRAIGIRISIKRLQSHRYSIDVTVMRREDHVVMVWCCFLLLLNYSYLNCIMLGHVNKPCGYPMERTARRTEHKIRPVNKLCFIAFHREIICIDKISETQRAS
jgi:hypothetical protein